jgi:hypothetical protein
MHRGGKASAYVGGKGDRKLTAVREYEVWLEPVVNDVHNASACVGKIDGMVNIRHLSAAKAKGLKVGAELFLDFVPA